MADPPVQNSITATAEPSKIDSTSPLLPPWASFPLWLQILCYYLMVQAVFGIVALEWAWFRSRRFRNGRE